LFRLPEYDEAARVVAFTVIDELSSIHAPSLRLFPRRSVAHVPTTRVTVDDGETVRLPPTPFTDSGTLDIRDVVAGCFDKLGANLDATAQRRAKALVAVWENAADVVTDATGNVHRGGISWESLMAMIDKAPIGFDEDGNPTLKIVAGTGAADAFAELPELTPDQRAAWDSLMERKRDEFAARECHRRLS
jgi:hypothetical protein